MRFALLILLVAALDQATKLLIVREFTLYQSREIIPGLFSLTYLTNTGAAFGMLAGHPTWWRQVFFVTVGVVALGVICYLQRRLAVHSRWYTLALGLIGGGALGNLIDRVRLGSVVDFLDFYIGSHHWPAFNLADSAICVGVFLFLLTQFLIDRPSRGTSKRQPKKES